jgi:hypothetical protein
MLIAMIAELRCNSLLDGVQGGLRGVQLLSNINSKCDGAALAKNVWNSWRAPECILLLWPSFNDLLPSYTG